MHLSLRHKASPLLCFSRARKPSFDPQHPVRLTSCSSCCRLRFRRGSRIRICGMALRAAQYSAAAAAALRRCMLPATRILPVVRGWLCVTACVCPTACCRATEGGGWA